MKLRNNSHSVKRFSLTVDYPELKSAKETQEKVLAITRNKLVPILENTCNIFGNASLIRIKNLTVDLGDIPINEIELQLPRLFQKKINQIFSDFNSNIYTGKGLSGVEVIDAQKQFILYFSYYLKYGTTPWYFDNIFSQYTFNEVFDYLIKQNSDEFIKEFFDLLENSSARSRLIKYIDSGEVIEIINNSITPVSVQYIIDFYNQVKKLIQDSFRIESIHRNYLLLYLKEFLLLIVSESRKKNKTFDFVALTKQFVGFVSVKKNISLNKWVPAIFYELSSRKILSSKLDRIVLTMQQEYFFFIADDIEFKRGVKITKSGYKQFDRWVLEKQPVTGRWFLTLTAEIVKDLSVFFRMVDKGELEKLVKEIISEILPEIIISSEDFSKWINVIIIEIKTRFGVSVDKIGEKYKSLNIAADKQSKTEESIAKKKTKEKETTKKISERTSERTSEGVLEKISECASDKNIRDYNIALVRQYISLFIKAGIAPFRKIYKSPETILANLFEKYIIEEVGSKDFIKEQVGYGDILFLWRIKESFGERLFKLVEPIVSDEYLGIYGDVVEFDSLLFIHYIRTGTFPWIEIIEKGKVKLIKIVEQFILTASYKTFIEKVLVKEEFFYNKESMEKVFETLSVKVGKELLIIRKELIEKKLLDTPKLRQSIDQKQKEENILEQTSKHKFSGKHITNINELADILIIFFSQTPVKLQKSEVEYLFKEIEKSANRSFYETALMLISLDKKIFTVLMDSVSEKQKEFIKKLVKSYKTRFIELAEEIKELEKEMEASVSEEGLEQIEAFYIGNAGLVLLNVYMKRLFERLGFLDKKDFKSEEFRERAVYILQYLVSKDVNPDENSLILNKLLVGMPLYNPLKFDINITDQEKEICDSLLDSVIKNWSVLKNTSRDGLRTSFFLRSGSLSEEETAWRLRVEKKAYDILLKKIPWGYTMIHFPWMKKPLSTEWEV